MKEVNLHITDEEMQSYIRNELADHHRQRVELEIQLCEACLESFIYWNSMEELAYMPQSDQAAEQIATIIKESKQLTPKRRWIQHPWAQVVVAASITLLLVGSGAMSMITSTLSGLEETGLEQQLDQSDQHHRPNTEHQDDAYSKPDHVVEDNSDTETSQSSSEKWLNKAVDWIQKIQDSRFEG